MLKNPPRPSLIRGEQSLSQGQNESCCLLTANLRAQFAFQALNDALSNPAYLLVG